MSDRVSAATERRKELYSLLGDLPARDLPMTVKTVCVEQRQGYTVERLILNPAAGRAENPYGLPIPAVFLRPDGEGPFPTVLFSHSHGGFYDKGKEEIFSPAPYMYPRPYGEDLTKLGFAVLAIDSWCFGERSGRIELSVFKDLYWHNQVLWGRMVYDSLRAFDYLLTRKDVLSDRIGVLGMSMGSTMSWWLAALEERIKVCADICCLTDFDALLEEDGLSRHGIYYFVPGLLDHFTASEINALIAPRPRLATVGIFDPLNPLRGVDRIEREVKDVYEEFGAKENFSVLRYPVAHKETAEMRQDILNFLKNNL